MEDPRTFAEIAQHAEILQAEIRPLTGGVILHGPVDVTRTITRLQRQVERLTCQVAELALRLAEAQQDDDIEQARQEARG